MEQKEKKRWSKTRGVVSIVLALAVMIGLGVGNYFAMKYEPIVTTFLGGTSYKVVQGEGTEDTEYFKRTYTTEAERLAADREVGIFAASEGFVLLKNEDQALPLANGSKVTLFGVGSADILYGGGGSGAVDTTTVPSLRTALEKSGFTVNPDVWDFYTVGGGKDYRMDVADIAGTGRSVIHEAPASLLAEEEGSFASYGDAAIVAFSRSGSESSDVPLVYDESYMDVMDVQGYLGSFHSEPLESAEDLGRNYLELTKNEEDLLEYVAGKFDKVVVLINSGNAMQLSFTDEERFGVDACLWIGNPGQDGLYALGEILNGNVNPSGRTVDTYAYDPTGAPAILNFGRNTMTGAENERFKAFVVYQEGIYVGYKYYETRYEDVVLGQGNADSASGVTAEGASAWDYSKEVQYPFGYGLSYTSFEKSLKDVKEDDGTFTVTVEVKNTGDVAGKDVVEVYAQSPYTEYDKANGVEKAAVQLVGFAKTSLLDPQAAETVTITFTENDLKSYDAKGEGSYILEAGDYLITAAAHAHDAVNNVLAYKGADTEGNADLVKVVSLRESDVTESPYTGKDVVNRFDDADLRTYDANFTYLSRSDWEATYPTHYQVVATEDMLAMLAIPEGTDDPDAVMPTLGAQNGLTLAMMRGVDGDAQVWDDLLDQMTAEEMYNLVRVGGYQTQTVNSVSAPGTVCVDGPAYVGNAGTTGVMVKEATYAWPSEVVLASSWNIEVLEKMGEMIGEDCLAQGELNFAGWYAPAMNIHRTAFSGRNFEYYSEDGFLSGKMGAATVRGARSKGVISFVKHFALNDQETSRTTINTFSNEQAIREIYLKAFEESVAGDTPSLAIMASMNRIGLTWSGDHKGLMRGVVRDEWGYHGFIITDQASYPSAFPGLAIRGGLEGGTDLWLNSGTDNWQIEGYQNNPTVVTQLREASRHILYGVANSLAMNGIASDAKVVKVMPLWQTILVILSCALAFFMLILLIMAMKKTEWKQQG